MGETVKPFLRTRSYEKEIMDVEKRGEEETVGAYRLIRRVNRVLGGTRVTLYHLKKFSRRWPPGSLIQILDVASGIADIPQAIVRWGRKKGFRIQVAALDLNRQALRFAKLNLGAFPEIRLVEADIFNVPFPPGSFDYLVSSQFFHHLTEDEVVRTLKLFSSLATRGIIVNDLVRNLRAYLWIRLFSSLSTNAIFRYDAPLSVRRGFRRPEIQEILRQTGLDYLHFYRHPYHRFAIAGEKNVRSL